MEGKVRNISSRFAFNPMVSDSEFTPSNPEKVDNQLEAILPALLYWHCGEPSDRGTCAGRLIWFFATDAARMTLINLIALRVYQKTARRGTLPPVSFHRWWSQNIGEAGATNSSIYHVCSPSVPPGIVSS